MVEVKMTDFRRTDYPDVPLEDAVVIKDYAEFSNQTVEAVVASINKYHDLNQKEYGELQGGFYEKSQTYIYDILSGNPTPEIRAHLINRFIPNGIGRMVDHVGDSFADFGGGTGVMCEIMARASNKKVTYIDIPSHMTEFAQWRFKKHGLDVEAVVIPEEGFTLPSYYNVIFTDAVWEHLPPDKQVSYLFQLMGYLKNHGLFYFLVDLSGHTAEMPMHFDVDIRLLHDNLLKWGMVCLFGKYSFASVWRKAVTFTRFEL
jgi:2-polyprenyl-3-methyl-5-hydroxy-6-metoxy-1,4-benzoquinol methylase